MLKEKNAYIITNPMIAQNRSGEVTLSKFLRVIRSSFTHITVIGGNLRIEPDLEDVELISFDITRAGNKLKRAIDIFRLQLKMSRKVTELVRRGEPVFFWVGDKMLLPFFAAKRKRAQINYFIYGNMAKEGSAGRFARLSADLIRYMAGHADYVCMESPSVAGEWPGLAIPKSRTIHLYTANIELASLEHREKTFGMVCRLTEGKHVLESIRAMAMLHRKHPDWNLEIIGSGRQQADCEQLIRDLDAEGYITLLGWVEHDALTERSKKWSYLVFPTDTEGLPNGLIEMMGRGIPALASPVGGIRDVIREGANGSFLEDTTPEAICDGMRRLIGIPPEDHKNLCIDAHRTIAEGFSLSGAVKNAEAELL